jgi:hypothetical protein
MDLKQIFRILSNEQVLFYIEELSSFNKTKINYDHFMKKLPLISQKDNFFINHKITPIIGKVLQITQIVIEDNSTEERSYRSFRRIIE